MREQAHPPSAAELEQRRCRWKYRGQERPSFALAPGDGQESVWDYPRPPVIRADNRRVEVARKSGELIASTTSSVRVLETAGPPVIYLPPSDVDLRQLVLTKAGSVCEWKGLATYYDLSPASNDPADVGISNVGWRYESPFDGYEELASMISFYPAKLVCRVDGETVRPQHGGFYGGWVTDEIVGPWKGEPGTQDW